MEPPLDQKIVRLIECSTNPMCSISGSSMEPKTKFDLSSCPSDFSGKRGHFRIIKTKRGKGTSIGKYLFSSSILFKQG